MALNKLRGGIKAYWADKSDSGSVQMFGNYGERFGMSRQEFEDIRTHLKLHPYTAAEVVRVSECICDEFVTVLNNLYYDSIFYFNMTIA